MSRPCILISNDDGIEAAGIGALAKVLDGLGEVWVVAPDREQSASSHSISLHVPLRVQDAGERRFAVSGTPADSVYLAVNELMGKPPDVVVSGINHGPNLGSDVLYSGTVSAAMEGALMGFPAFAFSLCVSVEGRRGRLSMSDFEVAADVAQGLVREALVEGVPPGVVLNVNVPHEPADRLAGIKLSRLGYTDWADCVTVREDPRGQPYYWIGGERAGSDVIEDSDNNAVRAGYVSMTPIHYDLTDSRSFRFARQVAQRIAGNGLRPVPDGLGDLPLAHPVHPRARRNKP